jgi:hypothetical protein
MERHQNGVSNHVSTYYPTRPALYIQALGIQHPDTEAPVTIAYLITTLIAEALATKAITT